LIDNAIKYSDASGVVKIEGGSDGDRISIAVSDRGHGIAQEHLPRLFERFYRVDAARSRAVGGTGLGLSISNKLVHLMHGTIEVESVPGQGTIFRFILPLTVTEPPPKPRLRALHQIRDLPVLVVDDNATNRRILLELLTHWRLQPTVVASAAEAIEAIQKAAERKAPFQLGLFDMMMPDVDGLMLTEQIRALPHCRTLPIIMLSSAAQGGDLHRCRKMGISRYLLKPFVHSELLDAILETVDALPAAEQDDHRPARPQTPSMRILLAEDGMVNQRVGMELLRLRDHQVTVASDGREALDAWQRQRFDLILMDLQMPEMDGFQATRRIREAEIKTGTHIPIVAMTARAMKDDRRHCFEAGMDDYVSKPIDPRELDRVLERYRPAARDAAPVAGPTDQPTDAAANAANAANAVPADDAPAGGDASVDPAVADIEPVLERFKGNRDAVRQLAESFYRECPELLAQIEQACAQRDGPTLRRAAHTLKGTADLFAGQTTRDLCAEIEQQADQGELAECQERLTELRQAAEQMLAALRQQLG
jgi:CheY-like chemotaxis protein